MTNPPFNQELSSEKTSAAPNLVELPTADLPTRAAFDTPRDTDIFLLPTRSWDEWRAGTHLLVADHEPKYGTWNGIEFCAFLTQYEQKPAFAFRIEAKRLDDTAVLTKRIIDHFGTPAADGRRRYRIDRFVVLGFCGTLKEDEFKLGDIGVASQIDCYMEKAKISDLAHIEVSGEVYRTSLEYVRLAQNLKYLDPEGFERFQRECVDDRNARAFPNHVLKSLREGGPAIHAPHMASATLLSTTKAAVGWLKQRDRKLLMIDMETGGMMAAIWAYNQCAAHTCPIKTLVIRGVSDFTDEKREDTKAHRREMQKLGVRTACRFFAWILRFSNQVLPTVRALDAEVEFGLVVPLEEEFSYLVEELKLQDHHGVAITPRYDVSEMRFSYCFSMGGRKGICMFMGDMGLVQAALTASALLKSLPSLRLLIQVGVGGSIDQDVRICDVAVATRIDPFLQGALLTSSPTAAVRPFEGDSKLIAVVGRVVEDAITDLRRRYRVLCREIKVDTELEQFREIIREPETLVLHQVPFASSDAVAASKRIRQELRAAAGRENRVVEMEAGGMYVATERHNVAKTDGSADAVHTLFFRGISDNATEDKRLLDAVEPTGILRKIAMKNASNVIFRALSSTELWDFLQHGPPERVVVG